MMHIESCIRIRSRKITSGWISDRPASFPEARCTMRVRHVLTNTRLLASSRRLASPGASEKSPEAVGFWWALKVVWMACATSELLSRLLTSWQDTPCTQTRPCLTDLSPAVRSGYCCKRSAICHGPSNLSASNNTGIKMQDASAS